MAPIKLHRVFLSKNQEKGIFTESTISPPALSRQGSSRSILHAGRYLNDKELRYLGTINVMADVNCEKTLVTYQPQNIEVFT